MMGKALSDKLSCMHTGLINNCSIWLPDASFVYPIALRKAKIVYNFGLSECNRVKSECNRSNNKLMHELFVFFHKNIRWGNCLVFQVLQV